MLPPICRRPPAHGVDPGIESRASRPSVSRARVAERRERVAFAVPSGMKNGDVIVEVEGRRTDMKHSQYLAYIAQKKQAGDKLSVKVLRAGQEIAAAVQLP